MAVKRWWKAKIAATEIDQEQIKGEDKKLPISLFDPKI